MSAVSFLTIVGRGRVPTARTLWWFPVVGVVVGTAAAGVHRGAHGLWPAMAAGAIVVVVDLVLTGALHLDGLADTADGLLPHMDREQRLTVMAKPDVGAFAVAVVVSVLMIRWAVLAEPGLEPGALIAIWAMSRTIVAIIPAVVPYARSTGLATPFLDGASIWLGVWLIPAAALLIAVTGWPGAVAFAGVLAGAAAVVALAWRRLGGFTGDVLGAVILVSETVGLLAIVVQP